MENEYPDTDDHRHVADHEDNGNDVADTPQKEDDNDDFDWRDTVDEPLTPKEAVTVAARLAAKAVRDGRPGLFTAIVLDAKGRIVTVGRNEVRARCDPTAHAEVVALRKAARRLSTIDLTGFVLCSNAEPCPMCLAAAYWAGIRSVYYGCSRFDVRDAVGFDDAALYDDLARTPSRRRLILSLAVECGDEATAAFKLWRARETIQPTDASSVSPSTRRARDASPRRSRSRIGTCLARIRRKCPWRRRPIADPMAP